MPSDNVRHQSRLRDEPDPNLANSTCRRTLSADGQLTEIVHIEGGVDDFTNEDLERFIAGFPIERLAT